MLVGYARTSTAEQLAGLEAQQRDLRQAGCERVFAEQVSSVAQRATLAECLSFMRTGDVLVVSKPDRLARSTAELLSIEAALSKRGVGLVVLSMGGERLDTRNPTSKLMLTILAGVATWEREIMLERQREGIAKAKAEGRYKGRAPTARRQGDDVLRMRGEGMTPTEIARQLGISRMSVYRVLADRVKARESALEAVEAATIPLRKRGHPNHAAASLGNAERYSARMALEEAKRALTDATGLADAVEITE